MTIGAVVVNHNAGAALTDCLLSLRAAGISDIVVVDNASNDNSIKLAIAADAEVSIVRTGKNLGYGTAANIGRRRLACEYLFVCNPDLIVEPDTPRRLADYLDHHPTAGIAGPLIYESTGEVYPSARSFPKLFDAIGHGLLSMFWPNNPFSRRYRQSGLATTAPQRVDWVSGACFLIAVVAFDAVDGFDERYFMYVEDLDLCWRLSKVGWTVAYVPTATVVHRGGLSTRRHPYRMIVAHHISTWRFAKRSLVGIKRLLLPLVGAGILARLVFALIRQTRRR